jgi:ribosome biogenesis GTPase
VFPFRLRGSMHRHRIPFGRGAVDIPVRRRGFAAYPRRMTVPAIDLRRLGWDDSWREAALPYAQQGRPGRVARVDRGLCTLWGDEGPVRASFGSSVLDAVAADPLQAPCTGDWGLVRRWPDGPITLETVLPRRTAVIRAEASGSSRGQVLAANIEIAAVVVALHPEPNLARVERLLSLAWASGARPVVVLTKADLVTDTDLITDDIRALAPDLCAIATSTVTDAGFDELRELIADGGTMALLGASGQGKSSLVNQLVGAKTLATRKIRDDGKGRHTSVRRELVLLPSGGSVIDTPGLRGVGLQTSGGGVAAVFPDIAALAARCRFADCSHRTEPGCAVRQAVAEGRLPERRLTSWRALHLEGADMSARGAERARWQAGKRSKFESKQQKANQRALRRGQL